MEEEDESRGKTEESGEDRGDGPPDRDPTLSPSAFILVRLVDTQGQGRQGWAASSDLGAQHLGPGGEEGLGAWTLGSSDGFGFGYRGVWNGCLPGAELVIICTSPLTALSFHPLHPPPFL